MCGRTCLTLQPDEILCACKYEISNKTNAPSVKKESENDAEDLKSCVKPEWRAEYNCGRVYIPSYNIAPTDITPVLISSLHFCDENEVDEKQTRVVVPMMWGMIPFWHKGDYRKHGLTTNNCRLEHMLESKLYSGPFHRGQRCVVLCEGFYEWQTTKTAKPSERAVHFIHVPQTNDIKIYDNKSWSAENVNLLKMAGLFDIWTDENGDKMYSYSVITFESSKILSWMHHRMPAILETEEQVNDWLDFKRVTDEQALATLRPAESLCWYRVSNIVNNSRNKSTECNKPLEIVAPKKKEANTLLSWLNVRKRREENLVAKREESESSGESDEELDTKSKRPRYREKKEEPSKPN